MNQGGETLLVVDDAEENRDMLSRRLAVHGFQVRTAADGAEALTAVHAGGVDLVLLDVEMPGLSGLDVLAEIRKSLTSLDLPVIMVTGKIGSTDIIHAFDLGANDYITKPVDFPVAMARIRTHLSLSRMNVALRESEERYALAARGSNDGLWDWDLRAGEIHYSSRWKSILGYDEDSIRSCIEEWLDRVHPEDIEPLRARIDDHLNGRSQHFEHGHRILHRNGSYRWVVSRGIAVRDPAGTPTRFAGSLRDITAERITDPLTGLANRFLFLDRVEFSLERSGRQPKDQFAVLFLDLDRFRLVNDSFGRTVGDRLLIAVAKRLESCLRSSDIAARVDGTQRLARVGGDEFAVLLDDVKNATNAIRVAERILADLAAPYNLDGHEVFTTATIGMALNTPGYKKANDLLRDAETAMNRAKDSGTARWEFFDLSMRDMAASKLRLESDLRRDLERKNLTNHYQLILSADTEQPAGFEALVRWRHPEQGLLSPGRFIPIAEETGLIVAVDQMALEIACRQMRAWQAIPELGETLSMNVNVSAKLFNQSGLEERIQFTLLETGLHPSRLKLEVTESVLMRDVRAASRILARLKSLGVRIAIDDFGTGYSSLNYLHQFPVDSLKVDRSFISQMNRGARSDQIIIAIISLAHSLGMEVVAEGVETREQFEQLRELGCEYVQGFYISRPLEASKAQALLLQGRQNGLYITSTSGLESVCREDPEMEGRQSAVHPCPDSADLEYDPDPDLNRVPSNH